MSDQVPGVLLFDENKLEEMSQIIEHYIYLVPAIPVEGHYAQRNGNLLTFDDTRFWTVLFGGEQLTVAWIPGTQTLQDTQETAKLCLEGVVPVVKDWHSRTTFMKVDYVHVHHILFSTMHIMYTCIYCDYYGKITIMMQLVWGRLFTDKSKKEIHLGTMYHLKNLICRTVVPGNPQKNMNAAQGHRKVILSGGG